MYQSKQAKWRLPPGIKEYLPTEARKIESLRRQILDLYTSWGYQLVSPSPVEYLSSLLTGTGKDLARSTFKFPDNQSTELLGIRADITPQVTRIDAHRLGGKGVRRLCYQGTVLKTQATKLGGNRNILQIGAELYGSADESADLEILCLLADMLSLCKINSVLIDLGHIDIYRGLIAETKLTESQKKQLFAVMQHKAQAELDELLSTWQRENALSKQQAEGLRQLPSMMGGTEVIEKANQQYQNAPEQVKSALSHLAKLTQKMTKRYPQVQIHIDLAELRGFEYHTGLVFSAYHKPTESVLAQGGRYDNIGEAFGTARAATGFSADLQQLMEVSEQPTPTMSIVLAPVNEDPQLIEYINTLRNEGHIVMTGLASETAQQEIAGRIVEKDGQWQTQWYNSAR